MHVCSIVLYYVGQTRLSKLCTASSTPEKLYLREIPNRMTPPRVYEALRSLQKRNKNKKNKDYF